MKLWLCLVLVLFCSALVLAQKPPPAGERPQHDNPPSSPEKPQGTPAPTDEPRMCTLMLITCPNGETATQDKYCRKICGAAPTGTPSYNEVNIQIKSLYDAYNNGTTRFSNIVMSSLMTHPDALMGPNERVTDFCIDVEIAEDADIYPSTMPDVWNGVRVFYTQEVTPVCSPILCPDGTLVGCNDVCSTEMTSETISFFWPMVTMTLVFLFSACCCCMCSRRKNRCKQEKPVSQSPVVVVPYTETAYPSEQYELLVNQEPVGEVNIPMMYPPMPPMMMHPPQMMFPPMNNPYPVMMQGPNGMWYPVVPTPEDA